jgi:hypothetical protein
MLGFDMLPLLMAAGMRVRVCVPVVDAARLPRGQVAAEVTLALEVRITWRGIGGSLLHLRSSGHLANDAAVSYDVAEASGNASGDPEML